jgi:hypothetical protein
MVEPIGSVLDPWVTTSRAASVSLTPGTSLQANDIAARGTVTVNGSPVVTETTLRGTVTRLAFEGAFLGVLVALLAWSLGRRVNRAAKMRAWLARQPKDPLEPYRSAAQDVVKRTQAAVERMYGTPPVVGREPPPATPRPPEPSRHNE